MLLPLFRSPLPKNRQPQSLNLSLRNHCSRVARCISFAPTHCYCRKKPTGAISLAPIRPSLRSCLFPATSFLPISPSLRESNAKRYDRGNPNHKNDRQTKSFAPTHCYCRKKPTGAISLALYARHCERATRSVTNAAIPVIRTTDKQNLLPLHTVIAEKNRQAQFFCPYTPVIAREQREALRTRQSHS